MNIRGTKKNKQRQDDEMGTSPCETLSDGSVGKAVRKKPRKHLETFPGDGKRWPFRRE